MGQSLKNRSRDHSHFQLSAASHISREHCWFSFHWALVKWGRIRTLFLLSCSFICACQEVSYYQIWLIGLQQNLFSLAVCQKIKSSENTGLSYLPEICEEVVCVCALWSTHAVTLMFLQKTEFTTQLIRCQNSNCGYCFSEQMYMLTVVNQMHFRMCIHKKYMWNFWTYGDLFGAAVCALLM